MISLTFFFPLHLLKWWYCHFVQPPNKLVFIYLCYQCSFINTFTPLPPSPPLSLLFFPLFPPSLHINSLVVTKALWKLMNFLVQGVCNLAQCFSKCGLLDPCGSCKIKTIISVVIRYCFLFHCVDDLLW